MVAFDVKVVMLLCTDTILVFAASILARRLPISTLAAATRALAPDTAFEIGTRLTTVFMLLLSENLRVLTVRVCPTTRFSVTEAGPSTTSAPLTVAVLVTVILLAVISALLIVALAIVPPVTVMLGSGPRLLTAASV